MRGFVEPRTLAAAISQRARGPSCTRNYSAGIGRGRGDGPGRYVDTEESAFSSSYGHGAPLPSASSGRRAPLNAVFPGRGTPVAPGASNSSFGSPFSSSSAGRGFGNLNQTHPSDTHSLSNGPLLSNISLGRGSVLQRPGDDLFSEDKPPTRPSLNFGSSGFGRGKPAEKISAPEEIFSSDRKGALSSWSKWDEKVKTFDPRDDVSPAELRLLGDEESSNILQFPAAPQQPRHVGGDGRTQAWQSSASAPPVRAAPFQQPPSPSSPGRQPIQQPHIDARVQPQPSNSYAGWQQPIQQPYYDARVQQQPIQQPYYDTRVQQQPSIQYPPPATGRQPIQQPHIDARVQPQPSNSYAGRQQPIQQPYYDAKVQQQPIQQPYYDARVQQQPPMQYPPPATGWQQSAVELPQEGVAMSYPEASYSFNRETEQEQRVSGIPETNQQTHAGYPMGDLRYDSTGESMQAIEPPHDPSQHFPESNQGQYLYGSEFVPPPPVALDSSYDVSGYEYDWGKQTSESFQDSEEQIHVEAPRHVHTGLDYDGRIEECFKQGKLEDIDGIYTTMKAAQVRASAKTYGTILQSYMQLGKMDKVSAIYQEMSGVLFSENQTQNDKVKETSAATSGEGPTLHQVGSVASSAEMSSLSYGAQHETEFEEDEGLTFSRNVAKKETLSAPVDTGGQGFASFGRPESNAGTGMGRGKKVDSVFNFDLSGGLEFGGRTDYRKENIQADQGSKSEMHDDYIQTFTPVIQPGWHAFAPEGISVGRGAGRGRPHSPQARDLGIGSSMAYPSQQFDSGIGRGRSSYEQRTQVALQQSPPLYSRDSHAEPQYVDFEEPSQPSLSSEEAAERAMNILNARLSRRYNKLGDWGREEDDNGTRVKRRSPVQLAEVLRERKQPKKPVKVKKEIQLTEEEAKKEAERLKAMENNEAIQELQDTLEQFMKCYGEMALEPEHELGDFTNPDIDEKPFMPLEEYLEKAKPNIMKTGLIRSEKEWQNMVSETLRHAPYFEEFVERYSGPGRYTAKQENEDLEEIANTLPSDVGRGAKDFVQRSLLTLKSNPGFNLDEKQWMLATMVDEFSQFSVKD